MGGRGSASGLAAATSIAATGGGGAGPQIDDNGFSDTDTAPFHDLYNGRAYYQQQNLDIDTRTALFDYLDPNVVGGTLYNASQNMNYAVISGAKLTPQQQFMYDTIRDASHNLGYNVNLTRYDHGDFLDTVLKEAGLKGGHAGMSIAQLNKALTGQTYSDPRILSTSYNDFKNAADPSTFITREVKITYRAKASTQALMPGKGAGGDFGEMLLAPTGTHGGHNQYKILGVKYSGKKARPKGGSKSNLSLNQIEVIVAVD